MRTVEEVNPEQYHARENQLGRFPASRQPLRHSTRRRTLEPPSTWLVLAVSRARFLFPFLIPRILPRVLPRLSLGTRGHAPLARAGQAELGHFFPIGSSRDRIMTRYRPDVVSRKMKPVHAIVFFPTTPSRPR